MRDRPGFIETPPVPDGWDPPSAAFRTEPPQDAPAASETPQDAREVEQGVVPPEGEHWFLQGFASAKAECQQDHADLVKRAEDAEAREARLRAGIKALAAPLRLRRAGTAERLLAGRMDALLATPDADAQDEGVRRG